MYTAQINPPILGACWVALIQTSMADPTDDMPHPREQEDTAWWARATPLKNDGVRHLG